MMEKIYQKYGFLCFIIILILALFFTYNFFYKKQLGEINKTLKSIEEKSNFNILYNEYLALKYWIEKIDEEIKNYDNIDSILGKIRQKVRKLEIELLAITPLAIEEEEFFYIYPIEIRIKGTYHQLGKLIAELENSNLIVNSVEVFPVMKEEEGKYMVKEKGEKGVLLLSKLKISSLGHKK